MTAAVACIGAVHVDRKALAQGPVVMGSSNPVVLRTTSGGVARNVAEDLARLGIDVALAGRVGTDAEGDGILGELAGVGVEATRITRAGRTASYTAFIDPYGELVVGLADMATYDALDRDWAAALPAAFANRPIWFLDCNLPADTLAFLLESRPAGTLVAVDAVSVAKSPRLGGLLGRIDLLFVNRDEAEALAGIPVHQPLDMCTASYRLLAAGAGSVVVTGGRAGALIATERDLTFLPAPLVRVAEVTGAGDALIAGTLYGYATGQPPAAALALGLAAASLTIESIETVNPSLTAATLAFRAGLTGAPVS